MSISAIHLIFRLVCSGGEPAMEEVEQAGENWKYQETRLCASWASCHPDGTVKVDIEKMARK